MKELPRAQPRALVIINHVAAKARRAWPVIERTLHQGGVRFETHVTRHAGDATEAARNALREGYDIIAAVGGDGTLSETAAGFFELDDGAYAFERSPAVVSGEAVLALLPAGTGDDFARGLKGRRESLKQWTARLVNYCRQPALSLTRAVDVIHGRAHGGAASFISVNVVTIGLGAQVAGRVAAQGSLMQRLPGEARFVAAACGALAAWNERRVRVSVDDGEAIECRSNLLAVANGVFAGGGMMFAPEARVDDGLLDVLISSELTRATILRELPRIRRGAHLQNPKVRVLRARRVRIETGAEGEALPVEADGNMRGTTPTELRILPGALRIVI